MSIEPLIYALIFIAVFFLIEGVYLAAFGKSVRLESRVNRRLQLLEKGETRESVMETLRKEREQHRGGRNIPLFTPLAKKAAMANIAFTPTALIGMVVLLTIVGYGGLWAFTGANLGTRIVVSMAMGYGAVFVWLGSKAKKRLAMFEEQLPDAVELIVRSLRVGHPFASSINIVAKEMPDPLGTEFGAVADEASFGSEISECLVRLSDRIDLQDLRFLAVAVTIQSQSGGNLAEILDGLAKVIRSRFKLFRRVNAITAEAKWSGWFLSIFPVAALVMINVAQPGYYDTVQETKFFLPAAVVVFAFLVVNIIFMRAMVNIKV